VIAEPRPRGGWLVWSSLFAALVLATMPVPEWGAQWRPLWVLLVLVYWCVALPQLVGVATGWILGLALDVLGGGLLGQNALAMTLVAYTARRLYLQLRVSPLWQQVLSVMLMVAGFQVVLFWIKGMIGQSPPSLAYWLPTLSSTLVWPPLFLLLRRLRRYFRVG
jgi:rod shape-determining protein MreD